MPKFNNKETIMHRKCNRYCNEKYYCFIHNNCNKFNEMNKIKKNNTNLVNL